MQRIPTWLGDPTPIVRDTARWTHEQAVTVSQDVAWFVALWALGGAIFVGWELYLLVRDCWDAWQTRREERRIVARIRGEWLSAPSSSPSRHYW